MSNLKELTSEKHKEAEEQPFLKSIFAGNVDKEKYTSYLFQLLMVYSPLEQYADNHGIFAGIRGAKRTKLIEKDWLELSGNTEVQGEIKNSTINYVNYITTIKNDKHKLLAHIYVRHLGDMFGGQMLAKLLPGSNNMFKFDDLPKYLNGVRSQLDLSMAEEANKAFDFNIEMIKEYNNGSMATS